MDAVNLDAEFVERQAESTVETEVPESSETGSESSAKSRAGRPRNPKIDAQVLHAAFEIYLERGWVGLSIGAVARRAGVGKSALQLRWPNKADLVIACIEEEQASIQKIDTGSVHDDLLEFAHQMHRFTSGGVGLAALRLRVEAAAFPELEAALTNRAYIGPVRAARHIVRRAIDRGELPSQTSPAVVLDLIAGAVLNHVLATPPRLASDLRTQSQLENYFIQVVNSALVGVRSTFREPTSHERVENDEGSAL